MSQRRRKPIVTITIYDHAMTSDAEECTFLIHRVSEEKQLQLVKRLRRIRGLENVRIEDGFVKAGVDWPKLEPSDIEDGGYTKVANAVRKVMGSVTIRKYFKDGDDGMTMGELIYGSDWDEAPGASTEEEREVLGH